MDLATEGGRVVVEGKVPVMVVVMVPVVVVEAAAANDGEPEEPRVVVVVVAATEGEPEGVVEATALRVQVVVVEVTEGEGVEETSLLSAHWSLQKRNRASCVKIMVMFVQMLAYFTI